MNFDNDQDTFSTGWHLNIDTDSIIFAQCCIFNDDSDSDRQRIARGTRRKVKELMLDAGCDDYTCFLTTKTNFRDDLVNDYKANRDKVKTPRPINLAWGKRWCVQNLNTVYQDKLEADDLLGIYDGEKTIIWSIDKDLRQIPGKHLDDATRKVVTITETGVLIDRGKKVYFDGLAGFYFQCLTGDDTDYIVGCGKREPCVYKTGPNKGQAYIKRKGVGPKLALKIIVKAAVAGGDPNQNMLDAVVEQYKLIHQKTWQIHLETQANLLFMVREKHGCVIRRWTYDGRAEFFDLTQGAILYGYNPPTAEDSG